tara:strand:- start:1024 stop:1641 length:618 start_codon:yes stop_codon:yes gene_type:complete
MIGIIDYGMGNLRSVINAVNYLGFNSLICSSPDDIDHTERIILPGVGAFSDCMKKLHNLKFVNKLNEEVLIKKKPVLGICLGMQVMAKCSFEGGKNDGLGWFDAEVIKISPSNLKKHKVPNIGWNSISYKNVDLFKNIPKNIDLYFVHSYFMNCKNKEDIIASYDYEEKITAAVQKNNILATQFHPEKSQDVGLNILENFLVWKH